MRHRIGTVDGLSVFVEVEYPRKHGRPEQRALSICAEVYKHGRDVAGGQCIDYVRAVADHGTPAKAWSPERILRLCNIWERWHLNDLRAGCEHQRALRWDLAPIDPTLPTGAYIEHPDGHHGWNMLTWLPVERGGLLSAPCWVCGYKYGSQWLYEPLPPEVDRWARELSSATAGSPA